MQTTRRNSNQGNETHVEELSPTEVLALIGRCSTVRTVHVKRSRGMVIMLLDGLTVLCLVGLLLVALVSMLS